MEVYNFFLCCWLFTTAASFSLQNAILEGRSGILALDAQGQNCQCENGKCVADKQGNSKCVCRPGYALQDEFTCQPCDCGSLGKCIFVLKQAGEDKYQYEKKCVCDVGKAEKDGVCVDCFCGENSACDYDFGERRCYCIDGYVEKEGKCTKCDCGFNGLCKFVDGNKNCECDEGYTELNGVCEECDCGDQGTCLFVDGQKTCQCQPGFSVNNGICEPCDCGANSDDCVLAGGVKECKCKDRYADRYGTCEECYCGGQSTSCDFSDNQKTCSCQEGYVQKGETCELGCSDEQPCKNGGYCKAGFCFCLNGTRGEFCDEIDECVQSLCPDERDINCDYDVSSQKAYCRCQDGNLRYNPNLKQCKRACEDDTSCKNQGKCTGTGRDRFCDCLEGTKGDFCEEIPVCNGVDCGEEANCAFNTSTKSAECVCKESGLYYDSNKGKCRKFCEKDKECENGGKCGGQGSNRFCECPPGTRGDRCEVVDDCESGKVKCEGKGTTCAYDVKNKVATCQCKDKNKEYDPSTQKCRRSCDKDKECYNGAKCRYRGSNKFCECLRGTQGDRCEIIDDCASGRIKCRGDRVYCDFDTKNLKAACKCKDKGKEYDSRNGRCRRGHHHHHSSTEESSNENSNVNFNENSKVNSKENSKVNSKVNSKENSKEKKNKKNKN